jgi:hypothetical protein
LRLEAYLGEVGPLNIGARRELENEVALEQVFGGATLLAEKLDPSFTALHCAPTPCIEQAHNR